MLYVLRPGYQPIEETLSCAAYFYQLREHLRRERFLDVPKCNRRRLTGRRGCHLVRFKNRENKR